MDDRIKIQIENIAELCNYSARKLSIRNGCIKGLIFDIALQFYQLREWRIHLEYDEEAVYFVKWENDELIKYFAGHNGDSPLDVVNEFYEYAKGLIDDGFICINYSEIESYFYDSDDDCDDDFDE